MGSMKSSTHVDHIENMADLNLEEVAVVEEADHKVSVFSFHF